MEDGKDSNSSVVGCRKETLELPRGCIKTFIQAAAPCSWVFCIQQRRRNTGSWVEGVGPTDVFLGMHSVLKN